jgi:signal transduction protein with GAF and PtsI domain
MPKNAEKEYLSALNKISKAITSDLYLEDLLKLLVTLTANVLEAKICALWLLDEKENCFTIRATQAMSRDYLKKRSIKVGQGIVGNVALSKEPVCIPNVLEDKRYVEKELAEKEGLVSMLSVPMIVKEKVIGVLNVYTVKKHDFTKSDIYLLSTVANQAAVAIENTELMVKTKVIQEELETRKKVEKAKGILMKRKSISEAEAYRRIQKMSMDSRVAMRDIAGKVIELSQKNIKG